jgi:transposase
MGERSRHKEYCQLRQEIRGSDEYLIIGIDVSKDRHHAFFGAARGQTVYKRLVFENSYQGFKRLIDHAKAMLVQNGLEKMVFGLEPTGDYHKPLANFLITNGYSLVLVSGVALKRNRELLDNRWDKNDTKDSANIADLISQGKCLFYEYPSNEISTLRSLLSLRKRLKAEMHSVKMRIRNNLIAKHFPEMDRHYNETCIGIVRWRLDPKKISSMDFNSFFKMTSSNWRQEKRFRLIYDCARDSIGLSVDKGAEYDAMVLTTRCTELAKSIKEVESKIEETANGFDEYKYLLTIPGFGPYISAVVLASIGTLQFSSLSQIIKMAGLDLSASRSGKTSDNATPVISKKGKSELRYALYQAAIIASNANPHFKNYFTEKLMGRSREKGIKTKMLVKLSAKLLVIAWTLMKNKTSFDPCFLKQGNAISHCQGIKPKSGRFSRASKASPVRDRQTLEKRPDEG